MLSIQFPVRILPKENYEVEVGTDNNLILNHILDLQIVWESRFWSQETRIARTKNFSFLRKMFLRKKFLQEPTNRTINAAKWCSNKKLKLWRYVDIFMIDLNFYIENSHIEIFQSDLKFEDVTRAFTKK